MLYFRYLFTLLPFDFLRSVYSYSLFPAGSPLRKSTLKRIRNLSLKPKTRLQCLVQLLIPARSSPLRSLKMTGPAIIYRSEEHTSELPSLMRISDAVICLNQKTKEQSFENTTHKA